MWTFPHVNYQHHMYMLTNFHPLTNAQKNRRWQNTRIILTRLHVSNTSARTKSLTVYQNTVFILETCSIKATCKTSDVWTCQLMSHCRWLNFVKYVNIILHKTVYYSMRMSLIVLITQTAANVHVFHYLSHSRNQ